MHTLTLPIDLISGNALLTPVPTIAPSGQLLFMRLHIVGALDTLSQRPLVHG